MGTVHLELDAVFNAEVFGAEVESGWDHVHDDDVDLGHELEEFETGEANGAGSDDEDGFAGLRVAALDGVVADGEGFDEGEFVVGEFVPGVEFVGGDGPICFAESAGAVDPDDLDAGAAVGGALLRGAGIGVVDVGFEGAFVARFDVGDALADGDDFEAEFVAGGAGVGEEGELAEVAGEVGAADAHAVGADEGFAGAGGRGVFEVNGGDGFDVGEFDGVGHGGGD